MRKDFEFVIDFKEKGRLFKREAAKFLSNFPPNIFLTCISIVKVVLGIALVRIYACIKVILMIIFEHKIISNCSFSYLILDVLLRWKQVSLQRKYNA